MYLVILLFLIGYRLCSLLKITLKDLQNVGINAFFNLFLKVWEEKIGWLLQMILTVGMGLKVAFTFKNNIEALVIGLCVFLMSNMAIIVVLTFIQWIWEYLRALKTSIIFTLGIPFAVICGAPRMSHAAERAVALGAILISLITVYTEIIHIVSLSREYIKLMPKEKNFQIKSILIWLGIILINFYTLLVFIQFYLVPHKSYFIAADTFELEAAVDLFYYLVITFTTVGFGDIRPHTILAKMITIVISISGMLFSAVFIGTLLSKETESRT